MIWDSVTDSDEWHFWGTMETTSTCSSGDASTLDGGLQFSVLPMELVISVRQGGFSSDFTVVGFLVLELVDGSLGWEKHGIAPDVLELGYQGKGECGKAIPKLNDWNWGLMSAG